MRGHTQAFTTVSGSWTVPAVNCAGAGAHSQSADWIGLGGDSEASAGLEQTGTDSDCVNGRPHFYAWYELIPAQSVAFEMTIRPGDLIVAYTHVEGHEVTLRLVDLTRRERRVIHRNAPSVDVSSAEWIVEAPQECNASATRCKIVRLADFGTMSFHWAAASADGNSGPIGSPFWHADSLELQQSVGSGSRSDAISARPAPRTSARGGFSVRWVGTRPTPVLG